MGRDELYNFIAFIITTLCVIILSFSLIKVRRENRRLEGNQTALMAKMDTLRTHNGKLMAECQVLTLTKGEIKKQCEELKSDLKDAGIKIKRLESAVKTKTRTVYELQTVYRDSVVDIHDTIRCASYRDGWIDLSVCGSDIVDVNITTHDTLTAFIHRVPRKFLFLKFGTKRIDCNVVSSNPHTKIDDVKAVVKK